MHAFRPIAFTTVLIALAAAPGTAHADLVISKKPTSSMNCSGGICNATAADANLNVKDLTNMLATSGVSVFAEGAATDITVSDSFSWASDNQLTLGAYGSINVKAAISVLGTSGLKLTANAAATGGLFRLIGVGKISFWDTNSTLVINGVTYTLVNNISALVAAIAANPSGTYAFANDYNAAQDGSYAHAPITTTFNGIFEGLGNAIDNFTVYNPNSGYENIALFSQLGAGSQISDLNLINVSFQSNTGPVAPLVAVNNGTITHASATGAISQVATLNPTSSAGLVFDNEGTITRSHTAVNLSGDYSSGGLVLMNKGTITLSDAVGQVSASLAGGLVQENDGTISLSNVSGSISGESAGGLAETNYGTISTSNASGAVSASYRAGGLVSVVGGGSVYASYASGNVAVSGTDGVIVGGLVGYFYSGYVVSCFATGTVANGQTTSAKTHYPHLKNPSQKPHGVSLGGLVGYSSGNIQYAYATGSVTAKAQSQAKPSAVGGFVGRADKAGALYQGYSMGQVTLNARKFFGGVIGADDGDRRGQNKAMFWNLDTSGIDNAYQGAGNVAGDKGLKGLSDNQFRDGTLARHLDTAWGQAPNINNGYPYLLANPPPE